MVLGNFLYRVILGLVGYIYPAYACYNALQELNAAQMVLWCKFWCIMGFFTAIAPFADGILFWIPFYTELKLLFAIFLWYPGMSGTSYMWTSYVEPYMSTHRAILDEQLSSGRMWAASVFGEQFTLVAQAAQARAMAALAGVTGSPAPAAVAAQAAPAAPHQHHSESESGAPAHGTPPAAAAAGVAGGHAATTPPSATQSQESSGMLGRPSLLPRLSGAAAPLQDLLDSVWHFD